VATATRKAAPESAAASSGSIVPTSVYRVKLNEVVRLDERTVLVPGQGTRLRGDVLSRVLTEQPGAVASYTLYQD
jgi:hypothetical protein